MKRYICKHQTLEPLAESLKNCKTMPFVGEHHGTAGPVKTSFNETLLPIEEALIEAADQIIDFDKKPTDPWSGDHIGFYNTLGAVSRSGPTKGKRSYAARGMFEENAHRSNLHVLCEAHAQKVVISEGRATGVSFFHGDETHEVSASCEVVVSGGTMATPQILELSGIGDPEILEAAGLECLVESKGVGNNYQEHILTVSYWDNRNSFNQLTCSRVSSTSLPKAITRWMLYTILPSWKAPRNSSWRRLAPLLPISQVHRTFSLTRLLCITSVICPNPINPHRLDIRHGKGAKRHPRVHSYNKIPQPLPTEAIQTHLSPPPKRQVRQLTINLHTSEHRPPGPRRPIQTLPT